MTRSRVLAAAILLVLAGGGPRAHAQDVFQLQYSLGFPAGDTRDLTGEVSFLGMDLGFRRFASSRVSWGLSAGLQVFDESTTRTATVTGGAVSGRQYRYTNVIPLYAGVHYHLGRNSFHPYLAANAGVQLVTRRIQFGTGRLASTSVHAALAPEAGLYFPLGTYGGTVSVRYHLTSAVDGYRESHVSVGIGVVDDF
jgi:hypothetical protein